MTPVNSERTAGIGRKGALAVVLAAALAGFGAVYVMAGGTDNGLPPKPVRIAEAPQALPTGPGVNPLSVGAMAAFAFQKSRDQVPELPFTDAAGKQRTLRDWQGKVVLLNLWATWCAPCRKEMPNLDKLQTELGSDKFEVVAVSADKTGIEGAKKFLDQIKVTKIAAYADQTTRIHSGLKAFGMPTTLLIDAKGREIGRLVGPAEWDSDEAKTLIKAALAE